MDRTRTILCPCCELTQSVTAREGDPGSEIICLRCSGHRVDTLAQFAARESEHAAMYKQELRDAQDDVVLARDERGFYRDKMQAAYGSRELLIQVLSRIDDVHHHRGKRCACGKPNCRVLELLADPRVARLITVYDEERRTLRELRNANPEVWTDAWDAIDATLVYPQHGHKVGVGRHRATG